MITREILSELMSFSPEHYLTTTLYLQIEGSAQPSYAIELKELIKQGKKEMETLNLSDEVLKSVSADFRRITDYVTLRFSRENVQTLVIFSCSARKWWRVLTLKLPLRSQLTMSKRPNLRLLMLVLDEYARFLVILVERSRAQLFEVYAGEIQEYANILDEVPGKVRVGGFGGYEERRIERHIEDHVRRHFKHVADTAYELFKKHSHDSVILAGTEQNTNEFEHYLHHTLQERLAGTFHEEINANSKDVLEQVNRIESDIRIKKQREVLKRLFSQVNSGGLGIVGLDSTVRALHQGQVNFLVVQDGYGANGYRCLDCQSLLMNNMVCDYCGGKVQQVKDIVEEAVQQALLQGCQVKYITLPDSKLLTTGKIGAMLRFKV